MERERINLGELSSELQCKVTDFVKSQQSSLEKYLINGRNEMVYVRDYEDYVLFQGDHIVLNE